MKKVFFAVSFFALCLTSLSPILKADIIIDQASAPVVIDAPQKETTEKIHSSGRPVVPLAQIKQETQPEAKQNFTEDKKQNTTPELAKEKTSHSRIICTSIIISAVAFIMFFILCKKTIKMKKRLHSR
ncbi:hypothetical protein Dip510_001989 [Elusimicrobium posterum]|uniref:hypothetical protein n=1 Tax=Elusimicrobium posterum TaxID=3116653 RepID=UPI003C7089EB